MEDYQPQEAQDDKAEAETTSDDSKAKFEKNIIKLMLEFCTEDTMVPKR